MSCNFHTHITDLVNGGFSYRIESCTVPQDRYGMVVRYTNTMMVNGIERVVTRLIFLVPCLKGEEPEYIISNKKYKALMIKRRYINTHTGEVIGTF